MERLNASILVHAEPQWVFRLIADPRRHTEWDQETVCAHCVEGSGEREHHHAVRRILGVRVDEDAECVECTAEHHLKEREHGLLESVRTYDLSAAAGGSTRVSVTVDFAVKAPLVGPLVGKLLHGHEQRVLDRALRQLRQLAEHEARA